MTGWTSPPEPVIWTLVNPGDQGGVKYTTVTLRAPTTAELMKATADPRASMFEIGLRLISAVSAENVPFEVLTLNANWQNDQMSEYFDLFTKAPAPGPLEEWRQAYMKAAVPDSAGRTAQGEMAAAS